MRTLLFTAAIPLILIAGSPAFANPATEAEQGDSVYPPVSACHFVTQRMVAPNGHIILERIQVCN
jgi:hypothetical protein